METIETIDLKKEYEKVSEKNAMLRMALRLILNHPVHETGEWEVAVKEMQQVARMTLEQEVK